MKQTLGRYTLLGKLATGGMAEVFLARLDGTSGFERRVVIKRVLPQYATQPEFLKLFEQEARFASFLSHPHIATVSDFGVDEAGAAFLVMELVEGASLRTLLKEAARRDERPDPRLVCRIFSQVAEGLAAVHTAVEPSTGRPLDLVHRDVSPENVLLSRQGAVKLADFGIARAMNEVSTTNPDVVRGKVRYLAPEQVVGEPLSPAIDIWALGVSLYETLALQRPFPEDNEGQTVHAIANCDYPPLASLRSDLPAELLAVVSRCLQRQPSARYPDCQDLALDLERIASAGASSITTRVIGNWVDRLAPADELKPLALEPTPPPQARFTPPRREPQQRTPPQAGFKHGEPVPISMGRELELEPGPELELLEPVAEVPAAPPEPPRARWPLVLGLLGVVGLVILSVAYRRHAGGGVQMRQVLVTSTPAGATVKNGALVLGKTPWAGDLPAGHEVVLEVSAPGFQTTQRTIIPGDIATVTVALKKAR